MVFGNSTQYVSKAGVNIKHCEKISILHHAKVFNLAKRNYNLKEFNLYLAFQFQGKNINNKFLLFHRTCWLFYFKFTKFVHQLIFFSTDNKEYTNFQKQKQETEI